MSTLSFDFNNDSPKCSASEHLGGTNKLPPIKEKLGFGLGLRNTHFDYILKEKPRVDWFEAISENFMDSGGRPIQILREIAEQYPIVLHGVSMSIGSADPLNLDYLKRLKTLATDVSAKWVSDHLCWTGVLGINSHDLLPLPLNEAMLNHVAARVNKVQDILERRLVLENPSTYLSFKHSDMSEPDFLRELCKRTGCRLLLDVNNVFVSCFNTGVNIQNYMRSFPFEYVVQLHLAGHEHCGTHIIDTHDKPVSPEVWKLFNYAWQQCDNVSTLLEWDGDVPDFEHVHDELMIAKKMVTMADSSKDYLADCGVSATTSNIVIPNSTEFLPLLSTSLSTPLDFMVPEVMGKSHYVDK